MGVFYWTCDRCNKRKVYLTGSRELQMLCCQNCKAKICIECKPALNEQKSDKGGRIAKCPLCESRRAMALRSPEGPEEHANDTPLNHDTPHNDIESVD